MNFEKAKITKNKKGFTTNFLLGDVLFFQEKGSVYAFVAKSLHIKADGFEVFNGNSVRPVEMFFISKEGAQNAAREYRKQSLLDQIERHKAEIDRINTSLSVGDY